MSLMPAFFSPEYLALCPSSNDVVRQRVEAGASEGLIIVTDQQTAGRGRGGNQWISPPGNLYCSILLRPQVPLARYAECSFVAGLAVQQAIASVLPPTPSVGLKWPNDVLINQAKVAGILIESGTDRQRHQPFMIVGIGVNMAHYPTEGVRLPATALAVHGGVIGRDQFLGILCARFKALLDQWQHEGFAAIRTAWLAAAFGLEQAIQVNLPEGRVLRGRFAGLDASGALLLEQATGAITPVSAGEVILPGLGGGGAGGEEIGHVTRD